MLSSRMITAASYRLVHNVRDRLLEEVHDIWLPPYGHKPLWPCDVDANQVYFWSRPRGEISFHTGALDYDACVQHGESCGQRDAFISKLIIFLQVGRRSPWYFVPGITFGAFSCVTLVRNLYFWSPREDFLFAQVHLMPCRCFFWRRDTISLLKFVNSHLVLMLSGVWPYDLWVARRMRGRGVSLVRYSGPLTWLHHLVA
jgi:hypothetical protein